LSQQLCTRSQARKQVDSGAMGKRVAGKSGGRPAKVAKGPAGPLDDVLQLVQADPALSAALPHALQAPPSERHAFQQKVVDAAEAFIANLEEAAQRDFEAAEAAVVSTDADRSKLEADVAEARAVEVARASDKEQKAAEVVAQQELATAAAQKVELAKARLSELEASRDALRQTHAVFQAGPADLWEPLKASSLPPAQWRERNKRVAALLRLLEACGVPPSLAAAAEAALKVKADARGSFAQLAITAAEEAYKAKLAAQKGELSEADSGIVAQEAAIQVAEAEHAEAMAKADSALEASFAAQNTWAEQTTVVVGLAGDLSSFGGVAEARAAAAEEAQRRLEHVRDVSQKMRVLAAGAEEKHGEADAEVTDKPEKATAAEAEAVAGEVSMDAPEASDVVPTC